MGDIVDYSKKLNEESKKMRTKYLIICIVVAFLTFSIGFYLSFALNSNKKDEAYKDKVSKVYSILKDDWYYSKDYEDIDKTLSDGAIYGMLDLEKDYYTRYLTSLDALSNTKKGLGINVSLYKEYVIINEVKSKVNIEAGLQKGDIIKSIDNVSLYNKKVSDITSMLENKNSVVLKIERNGVEQEITCYVTSYDEVTIYTDFSDDDTAYIKIAEFAEDTPTYLNNALQEAKNRGYNKLILDLRGNPGGYITSVVSCADLLMEKGKSVLTTKDKNDNTYIFKTTSNSKYDFEKINILINNDSASGAEALSAALNENMDDIVNLIGVTTYGKGSAQKTIDLKDGTYFHYTYALWYTPNGNSIDKVGVEPEIVYTGSGIHLLKMPTSELKKGDYSEDVRRLQMAMKQLNYYNGEITGYFDEALETAVAAYQSASSITQTGELDSLTLRYLIAKYYDDKTSDYAIEVALFSE